MPDWVMRHARALGWAALAAAPVMLTALAVATSSPWAPRSVVGNAMWAAWIAGALAFSAALLADRGARTPARITGGLSALVAGSFIALCFWVSAVSRPPALEDVAHAALRSADGRLTHPELAFSFPDPSERDLIRSPELERETREAGDSAWADAHRVWAWEGDDVQLVLDLARDTGAGPGGEIAASLRRAGHTPSQVSDDAVEARLSSGGQVVVRVRRFEAGATGYRLTATLVGEDVTSWRPWLDELQTPSAALEQ